MVTVPDPILSFPIVSAREPIWISLRVDPHHNFTVYDLKGIPHTGRCVMRLVDLPDDVPAYVKAKIGDIDPYDWWWMRRSAEDGPWIEISMRVKAVIAIERFTDDEKIMIHTVDNLIRPYGQVVGIGAKAVGVLGDARSVGVSVLVKFSEDADVMALSTLIVNRVKGITRVMMDLTFESQDRTARAV